jgi:hypothetical protein
MLPRTSSKELETVPPSFGGLWDTTSLELVSFITGVTKNVRWLGMIDHPPWIPPDWIFGPV